MLRLTVLGARTCAGPHDHHDSGRFWPAYRSLVIGSPIAGNDVPDAAMVVMIVAHGVSTIYTRDRGFRRFDGIRVIDPFD